jgi:predicted metalloprotease with PDZ domain
MVNASAAAPAAPAPSLGVADSSITERGTIHVSKLDKFGSAAKAGLLAGDEILAINGTSLPASPIEHLIEVITRTGVGGTVNLRVSRQGSLIEIPVTLRAKKTVMLDLEEVNEVLERRISP